MAGPRKTVPAASKRKRLGSDASDDNAADKKRKPAASKGAATKSGLSEAKAKIIGRFGHLVDKVPEKKSIGEWMRRAPTGPSAPGSKQIPEGTENCLEGLTFVVTGEPPSLSRPEVEDLIRRCGGSKTTFLVMGEEAGATKPAKAKSMGVKVLDDDGLFGLISALSSETGPAPPGAETKSKAMEIDETPSPADLPPTAVKSDSVRTSPPAPAARPSGGNGTELWTDKYRPKSLKELCGNKGKVETIVEYLRKFKAGATSKLRGEQAAYKAVLVSGPPGIGKTTAVHLACAQEGFTVIEMNASDTRSKKALNSLVGDLTGNYTVDDFFSGPRNKVMTANTALVMDEVDGMSGGDRGGTAQLIQLIKKAKIPVLCICNDRRATNVKSLLNHCLDIPFHRPDVGSIRSRMMSIAFKEKLKLNPNAVDQLVQSTHNDLRQILNLLSTYRLSQDAMSYDQGKAYARAAQKQVARSPFDITAEYLTSQGYNHTSFAEHINAYFYDYSLIPLFIQENYPRCQSEWAHRKAAEHGLTQLMSLEALSHAADAISEGDLVERKIGSGQQWSLMPVHAAFSCVRPAYYMHGSMAGSMTQFPGWLGKNSTATKANRLLREFQTRMRLRITGDRTEVRLNYLPALIQALSRPLIEEGAGGIEAVIKVLDEYHLSKDDWGEIMTMQVGGKTSGSAFQNPMDRIPSNVKSAFTRKYNAMSHPTTIPVVSGGRATVAPPAAIPDLEGAETPEDETADSDSEQGSADDPTADALIKVKGASKAKKPAAGRGKPAGAAASSASGRGRGRGRRGKA
ncbi:DNA replication factor C complex subunit Rfc1 [Tieghemiomyces parasiticus]|uniref:Replication factor C subunit 1 n=1 Tax=Tieghemiomyces parasiticus TaxID=78921 RepID=A0A9W8AAJ9_9FUNG|nr:DNA replication factor C complex subunit Rfc1 [Tieghemiomyces parasiticus]